MKSNILSIFFPESEPYSNSNSNSNSDQASTQPPSNPLFKSTPVKPCLFCDSTSSLFEIVGGLVLVSGVLFRKTSTSASSAASSSIKSSIKSSASSMQASASANSAKSGVNRLNTQFSPNTSFSQPSSQANAPSHSQPEPNSNQDQNANSNDPGADPVWQKRVKQFGAFVVGLGLYNGINTTKRAFDGSDYYK